MNALRIEVDGKELVTVNLDGMHLLHVSVHSSLDREETALLEVHGGTYGGEVSGHRIWVAEQVLAPAQSVKVSFIDCAGPFDPGQTMADMFPDDALSEEFDFTMTDAKAAELRARPRLRNAFSMTAGTSSERIARSIAILKTIAARSWSCGITHAPCRHASLYTRAAPKM